MKNSTALKYNGHERFSVLESLPQNNRKLKIMPQREEYFSQSRFGDWSLKSRKELEEIKSILEEEIIDIGDKLEEEVSDERIERLQTALMKRKRMLSALIHTLEEKKPEAQTKDLGQTFMEVAQTILKPEVFQNIVREAKKIMGV